LRFTQGVPFDNQRPTNGTDAVDAPEPERPRLHAQDGQPPYSFADLSDEVDDGRGDGKRWMVLLDHGTPLRCVMDQNNAIIAKLNGKIHSTLFCILHGFWLNPA